LHFFPSQNNNYETIVGFLKKRTRKMKQNGANGRHEEKKEENR
jgi:hypothetical protein